MTRSDRAVRGVLSRLIDGEDLSFAAAERLFGRLMDGEIGDITIAALLTALAAKGESVEEIAGAATAMRRRLVEIPTEHLDVVDTCGTGGDGKGSFNISTAAAFIAAAAGAKVAKHGNRSVSSRSGSADVLEALGVEIETDPVRAGRALDEVGIAFLFAPHLHPTMRQVMPVRRELGVRTIFNILGPLSNPAGARRQVLGVFADRLVPLMAEVLRELGCDHALVVRGADGLDELTTTASTFVAEVKEDRVEHFSINPQDLGFEQARPEDLEGGEPIYNARLFLEVLNGKPGPLLDISLLNAGAAIFVGGLCSSLATGVSRAREAVASGAARDKLAELRAHSADPGS